MKKFLLLLLIAVVLGCSEKTPPVSDSVDVLLIGGGVMSATLGTYLQELEPGWRIQMVERLDAVALESSNAWNNAGTGHSAFCELNYTTERADGTMDISKAVGVAESFEVSRQFWSHQVEQGVLNDPRTFITNVPHMSFVWGEKNTTFLKKRHQAMVKSPLFNGMEYTEDPDLIAQWAPLAIEGRVSNKPLAATRMVIGTDVNFGEITKQLISSLLKRDTFTLSLLHEVRAFKQLNNGRWQVTVADLANGEQLKVIQAKFVFIGAGGKALTLLQKTGVAESELYAGFPVGGQFLMTRNQDIVKQHTAKMYGQAETGAPPMSVPHLDTRRIDGETVLLFGPFATFSPRFLKTGSAMDLPRSITVHNAVPMIKAGIDNWDLSRYLIGQLMLSDEDRLVALKEYFPQARAEDWQLIQAGQRVQVIKKDKEKGGVLQFGTELVVSSDKTVAALLGASPGASTAAPIMLDLLKQAFPEKMAGNWQPAIKKMVPIYGQKLNDSVHLTNQARGRSAAVLGLDHLPLTEPL